MVSAESKNNITTFPDEISKLNPFLSGAVAGLTVDMALYPLDTLKTRLQSPAGFLHAGGFSRLYAGLPSVMLGSAPSAALFFFTYELINSWTLPLNVGPPAITHLFSASIGEIVACSVRVPCEVIKQRSQANITRSISSIFMQTLRVDGVRSGLYRGFVSTVLREIPFSAVQFPLWEALKRTWLIKMQNGRPHDALSSTGAIVCGVVAGGFAGAVTTPLDVAKSRVMLSHRSSSTSTNTLVVLAQLLKAEGLAACYSGCVPRTLQLGIGGGIFLGLYQICYNFLNYKK